MWSGRPYFGARQGKWSVTTDSENSDRAIDTPHKKANDTIIERLTCTYDNAGNRLTLITGPDSTVTTGIIRVGPGMALPQ